MNDKKVILIVDDTKLNIEILLELLGNIYNVIPARNGEKALKIIKKIHIDLVLLDIMMPDMDGYEVCEKIKLNNTTKEIPIIFITAKSDDESLEKAYDIGGADYVTKPFSPKEVLSRVSLHLSLAKKRKILENENFALYREIQETQRDIIETLGSIGESRSQETGEHVKRVAKYSEILALHYGMSRDEASMLAQASPMHDIGKIAIPDEILNKPAKLTTQEFTIMKEHSILGYNMLKSSNRELLKMASILAHEHHEKWDGSGYPQGLKGEEIHIYGRITAVADVFDALGNCRVYKEIWNDDKIFTMFKDQKGKHFDPKLIDIFFDNLDQFLEIRDSLNTI